MARPLRIEYTDGYYHVMNCGRGRQRIFHDTKYFEAFLVSLQEAHQRFGVQIHSYCLMGNHYHLLLKTSEANLSRSMRHINGLYTQRYNRLKKTDGPLFRGRYKAIVVDSDSYLLQVSRYIHLNPLHAKLVRDLKRYPWSSYPEMLWHANLSTTQSYTQVSKLALKDMHRSAKLEAGVEDELDRYHHEKI